MTPWTVAHDAPLSMEFSRQEYWSRLPLPSQGTPYYWSFTAPDFSLEKTSRRHTHTHTRSSLSRVPFSFPLFLFVALSCEKPGSHYPLGIHLLLGPPVYKVMSSPHLPPWALVPPATAHALLLEPIWPHSLVPFLVVPHSPLGHHHALLPTS